MTRFSRFLFILSILAVSLLALGVRLRAVNLLPIDFDEDDYLAAGQRYAQFIRDRDLQGLIGYNFNYEHPPLTKIIYGLVILPLQEAPLIKELPATAPIVGSLPQPHFIVARLSSAFFSLLEVIALSIINPLAGFFLAINTWQIKYTSQIMLEPLPALTSLLTVVFYTQSKRKWNTWLILAAICLGITAASKYTYCLVGIVVLIDWLFDTRPIEPKFNLKKHIKWILPVILWGFISIIIFILADPRLWNDPLNRLKESLLFHAAYTQSATVRQAGYPPWQPLVWIFSSVPWHPGVFIITIDMYITILAVFGIRRLWQRHRIYALWLMIALGFLLVWPTKWPQYIIILTAPLSFSAAEGFMELFWIPLRSWLHRPRARLSIQKLYTWPGKVLPSIKQNWIDSRRSIPWLLPGIIVLALIVVFPMVFQFAMSFTDFSGSAIRDGLTGGVWREFWAGITGKVKPIPYDPFGMSNSKVVHYTGPGILLALLSGATPDLLVFNIIWTVLAVLCQMSFGVMVALLINRYGVRFKGWWQAIYILPWAIPEFVGALIWTQVFDPKFGWFNLAASGTWAGRADYPGALSFATRWQEDPTAGLIVLLITATWYGFPFMMLAATAGLKMIPLEVYDAAAIDGANAWQRFWGVTWPMLLPLLLPAIIIRSIFSFNQFYLFYVLHLPGSLATFAITSFFIFNNGNRYAVSAAFNIFTVIVLVFLILWFNRWSKAAEGVTYA